MGYFKGESVFFHLGIEPPIINRNLTELEFGMSQFTLRDGRTLDVLDNHQDSRDAIIFHHGTPGNSTTWGAWLAELDKGGVRAFAASRPGYAASDRHRGRRVLDVVDDLSQYLDAHEIRRFVSLGWSGGGPHALAMSLDPRCVGVITLAGVGQYGQSDLDFLAGMGPENIEEFGFSLKGEEKLRNWMNQNAIAMKEVTGEDLRQAFGGLIGEADREVLAGVYAENMASDMRRALAHGFDGWIDDDLAFVNDWGFEVGAINAPVQIWQGDDDLMVPHSHSSWLAKKIPNAELHIISGEGHISLTVNYREKIFAHAFKFLNERL